MTDRPYWCEICARKKECYGITLKPKCFVPTADRKTENSSEKPNNCDEPQTYITEDRDTQILDAWQVYHRNTTSVEDEPQTDCKDCKYAWWNGERYECSVERCR